MRQPHSAKSPGVHEVAARPITRSDRKKPSVAVVWIQLVA